MVDYTASVEQFPQQVTQNCIQNESLRTLLGIAAPTLVRSTTQTQGHTVYWWIILYANRSNHELTPNYRVCVTVCACGVSSRGWISRQRA